jgi:hypothetical protein
MISRLWYPQLDVFDAVRRIAIIAQQFEEAPGIERVFITDFFLANPPLLHRTSMPAEVRRKFNDLRVPRPEKVFISYPSAPILFHKMESIQKEALTALSSKNLLDLEVLKRGTVKITEQGKLLFPIKTMSSDLELILSRFLARDFANRNEVGNFDLRRRTGLRRPS